MAKREAPIKHLKVRIINIVLYPEDKQRKENYINLWEKIHNEYLQLIIPQYFISNKSGIWSLSLIVHSKG